ncbi:MAG: transporter permease, partial [Haloplasmataceae bacterium]|nr:transporter permease [Haloplasmataceae bacterium]
MKTIQDKTKQEEIAAYLFLSPYFLLFLAFIVVPVIAAILLSFTYFNSIEFPSLVGLKNYIDILTKDETFMQNVLPNTFKFVLIVGPGGYLLSFFLAWTLAQ